MDNISTIIFDFDGTLVDSLIPSIEIYNQLAIEFKLKPLKMTEIKELRNMSGIEAYKKSGITITKLPFVMAKARKLFENYINDIKLVGNLRETLIKLKEKGLVLGILSSNTNENIEEYLEKNSLKCFDFIYSGRNIFGKDKVMKKLLKDKKLSSGTTVYVGDEVRDIDAAKKAGIKIAAVDWGFNSKMALEKAKPDWLISKPGDLLSLFL